MSMRPHAAVPATLKGLTFEYGPMEAGKTRALHARHMAIESSGGAVTVLVCDPTLVEGLETQVPMYKTTRLLADVHHMAHLVGPRTDILKFITKGTSDHASTILIDNAHFLSEKQVHHLLFLTKDELCTVYCYGLRTDFRGLPFAASALLMARADTLIGHTGRCHCGGRSTATIRIDVSGSVVTSGDPVHTCRDAYRSLCVTHWNQATHHRWVEPTNVAPSLP